jgi:hypothetical protein
MVGMYWLILVLLLTTVMKQWFSHVSPNGKITDWEELDMDLYPSVIAARFGHYTMCDVWSRATFEEKES